MIELLTPMGGRLVSGSLYNPRTKDADGNLLTTKEGQPRIDYNFAVAIPKKGESHWSQTEWGAKIYAAGCEAFPQHYRLPKFAWKVADGDSTEPNGKGNRPCDREGYPGNWILYFSTGFPPQIVNIDGRENLTEKDLIKVGYYIQVYGEIRSNKSAQSPGVYLNHRMISFSGYGPRIIVEIEPSSVGFGGALPPGASVTPLETGFTAPSILTPAPQTAVMPPIAPAPIAPAPAPIAPAPITPYPQILNTPPAPIAPAPARQMTTKAEYTYEQYRAAGWSDEQLIASGLMLV